jgi:hypothetical protein
MVDPPIRRRHIIRKKVGGQAPRELTCKQIASIVTPLIGSIICPCSHLHQHQLSFSSSSCGLDASGVRRTGPAFETRREIISRS